jgi:radical SAM superfamily enzyme YgiQ (UPF0313 family)
MKLTLIKPNIGRHEHSLYVDEGRMEPLMLGVLAGLTPDDVDVALYDDRMEAIPYDEPADLVGITVETYTARRAYEISDEYRRRGVLVALGGIHSTLLPEESARHADCVVTGDAETVWRSVVEDTRRGRLQNRYHGKPGAAQIGDVRPRRDLFAGKGYLPVTLVQFSRGCRFACGFCAVSRYFNGRQFIREIDETLGEIEAEKRRKKKFFFFVDDNIAANREALKELCRALIPMKIKWVSQASLDVTWDKELMSLMRESGCLGHVMGFESITPDSLREAGKSPNLRQWSKYEEEIRILREYGLQTWAAFTLGYDHDTLQTIEATAEFAIRRRFAFAAFNILMPYPGTPFYRSLREQGRLLYDGRWWLHPSYRFNNAAFIPKSMTPEELTEACHSARTRFNSIPSLLRRFSDVELNMRSLWRTASYWAYATLFRREVRKKHGMKFGLK